MKAVKKRPSTPPRPGSDPDEDAASSRWSGHARQGQRDERWPGAVVHIKATFNNTTVTIADPNGDALCWAWAGTVSYKGSRKSRPFAAGGRDGVGSDQVWSQGGRGQGQGAGLGRESAITAIQASGLLIKAIEDVAPSCRTTAPACKAPGVTGQWRAVSSDNQVFGTDKPSDRGLLFRHGTSYRRFVNFAAARARSFFFLKGTRCDTPECRGRSS